MKIKNKLIKNRIKPLRAEHVLTQEDLANQLGILRQAVIFIEKYKYNPLLEMAFRIARLFNTSMEEIFTFEEEK